jgi:hypothetical protein
VHQISLSQFFKLDPYHHVVTHSEVVDGCDISALRTRTEIVLETLFFFFHLLTILHGW